MATCCVLVVVRVCEGRQEGRGEGGEMRCLSIDA
jgi:hypothetical protein